MSPAERKAHVARLRCMKSFDERNTYVNALAGTGQGAGFGWAFVNLVAGGAGIRFPNRA